MYVCMHAWCPQSQKMSESLELGSQVVMSRHVGGTGNKILVLCKSSNCSPAELSLLPVVFIL